MSLLPDSASFHERVQDCFVAHRGRGVALSAKDVELLDEWADAQVPLEVIARGIRKAAEAALWDSPDGEGLLRSLSACRRQVNAEIAKYLKLSAGKTEAPGAADEVPFHLQRHQKLKAALKKIGKAHEALSPAVKGLLQVLSAPSDFDAANRQEELALAVLTRAIPYEERRVLLREATRLVEKAGTASKRARRESLRFHRAALIRHRLGVPAFW
ncbi:MAG: hypothetical protein AMXMBFR34_41210 [Myxococcaceae bacterium]